MILSLIEFIKQIEIVLLKLLKLYSEPLMEAGIPLDRFHKSMGTAYSETRMKI